MADVIFVLISVFVCGFVLAFVVLSIASILYRVYTLRKQRRKLCPHQKCEIATVNGGCVPRRYSADVELGSNQKLPNEFHQPNTARTMSTTVTATTPLPSDHSEQQTNVDNKSQGSARSTECSHSSTAAVETEEQLLGVGHLPKDVQAEQDLQDAIKKAIGPPEPTLD